MRHHALQRPVTSARSHLARARSAAHDLLAQTGWRKWPPRGKRFSRSVLSTAATLFLLGPLATLLGLPAAASEASSAKPLYKPSSRSPQPMDILSNAYGASTSAPEALEVGDVAPEFSVPAAGDATFSLKSALEQGSVALIFYRGHW